MLQMHRRPLEWCAVRIEGLGRIEGILSRPFVTLRSNGRPPSSEPMVRRGLRLWDGGAGAWSRDAADVCRMDGRSLRSSTGEASMEH